MVYVKVQKDKIQKEDRQAEFHSIEIRKQIEQSELEAANRASSLALDISIPKVTKNVENGGPELKALDDLGDESVHDDARCQRCS